MIVTYFSVEVASSGWEISADHVYTFVSCFRDKVRSWDLTKRKIMRLLQPHLVRGAGASLSLPSAAPGVSHPQRLTLTLPAMLSLDILSETKVSLLMVT